MSNYLRDEPESVYADDCPCAYDRAQDCDQHGPRFIPESDVAPLTDGCRVHGIRRCTICIPESEAHR